ICALSFFLHATSSTVIYALSLHDALPIYLEGSFLFLVEGDCAVTAANGFRSLDLFCPVLCLPATLLALRGPPGASESDLPARQRSEEHTSELQSRENLVCRLLLEKKKKTA